MAAADPGITAVVPTIGRPALLRRCLESLADCDPPPAEVLVVDQSSGAAIERIVAGFSRLGARTVQSAGNGIAAAENDGIAAASSEFVVVTHDDCTVSSDWISVARRLLAQDPTAVYTGSVLAPEGSAHVPSTIDTPTPIDYSGRVEPGVLYPNNMAFAREAVTAFGGFDPRLARAAEDNDFCYRWLRDGRPLRYEPELRVWHHDWRSPDELRTLYIGYGEGQGAFYAKHLRRGDLRMLRFIAMDFLRAGRSVAAAVLKRDISNVMPAWMLLKGLPHGLRRGWRDFADQDPRGVL